MDREEFSRTTVDHCSAYVTRVEIRRQEVGFDRVVLYPSLLLLTETPTHFCAELLGATPNRAAAFVVRERVSDSTRRLFTSLPQGPSQSWILGSDGIGDVHLAHLSIIAKRDLEALQSRYPESEKLHGSQLIFDGEAAADVAFHPIEVSDGFQDLWMTDVLTATSHMSIVRLRYFQSFWLVSKEVDPRAYKKQLLKYHPLLDLNYELMAPVWDSTTESQLQAVGLATMASLDVHETTLTAFLEQMGQVLAKGLGGVSLIAQPRLPWLEGNPDDEEKFVQPDFLLVDEAGQGHLCEVKLPLLESGNLTTGHHKRRRFKTPVLDGLAQLANYAEYSRFSAHRAWVSDNLGVSMAPEPRQILVIGSAENLDSTEVREALRMHGGALEVVDLDSLRAMYLLAGGFGAPSDEADAAAEGEHHA